MSICPTTTPTSSVPVTAPRLKLPSLMLPTQYPTPSVRKIASSGLCLKNAVIVCLGPPVLAQEDFASWGCARKLAFGPICSALQLCHLASLLGAATGSLASIQPPPMALYTL